MTTRTIQTSQHTHNCALAPVQLLPPRRPRGRGTYHSRRASSPAARRPAAPRPLGRSHRPAGSAPPPVGRRQTRKSWLVRIPAKPQTPYGGCHDGVILDRHRRFERCRCACACRVVGPRGGRWRTIADCRARSRLRSSLVQLERNRMLKHLTRTHTGAMKAHHASVSANEGTSTARRSRASRHASNLRRRRRRVRAARRYADRSRECRSRTERRT